MGLSSPRTRCRSASLQTPFHSSLLFPRVQEPAAIRLRLRVFQTPLSYNTVIFFILLALGKFACKAGKMNSLRLRVFQTPLSYNTIIFFILLAIGKTSERRGSK